MKEGFGAYMSWNHKPCYLSAIEMLLYPLMDQAYVYITKKLTEISFCLIAFSKQRRAS